jgi:hypothetical protein
MNNNEKIREFLDKNRAAALGIAVAVVLGGVAIGNAAIHEKDDDDDSYYISSGGGYYGGGFHGGGYFFTRGSTYKSGSWSKSPAISGKGTYSSSRGGSIGS